jgi:arabinan endo-1,5-alpha-L-arabinosidase
VARSDTPLGVYYDDLGRSMLAGNRGYQVLIGSSYFAGPGHNSIIQDKNGDYWLVYHAFDMSEPANLGNTPRRSLMIDKLVWNESGWPRVFGAMPSNRLTIAPST